MHPKTEHRILRDEGIKGGAQEGNGLWWAIREGLLWGIRPDGYALASSILFRKNARQRQTCVVLLCKDPSRPMVGPRITKNVQQITNRVLVSLVAMYPTDRWLPRHFYPSTRWK